jgi:hypothetical protein
MVTDYSKLFFFSVSRLFAFIYGLFAFFRRKKEVSFTYFYLVFNTHWVFFKNNYVTEGRNYSCPKFNVHIKLRGFPLVNILCTNGEPQGKRTCFTWKHNISKHINGNLSFLETQTLLHFVHLRPHKSSILFNCMYMYNRGCYKYFSRNDCGNWLLAFMAPDVPCYELVSTVLIRNDF